MVQGNCSRRVCVGSIFTMLYSTCIRTLYSWLSCCGHSGPRHDLPLSEPATSVVRGGWLQTFARPRYWLRSDAPWAPWQDDLRLHLVHLRWHCTQAFEMRRRGLAAGVTHLEAAQLPHAKATKMVCGLGR